ncbi:hypothetical protein F4818DRAFT_171216 [Hypoxylon cercidicola]|nr:hypothetical protein F4818DRAFT_171216 [Hypoxylon cercidicola]
MTRKRKFSFSDFLAESSEHGETHERNPEFHAPKKSKKAKKSKVKPDNINWVKKRARTIERRFKNGQNMPADVQNELERELAHHQQKIIELTDEKKRKTMITKYHMVRFFERKKADRLAKQIQSQLNKTTDAEEIEKLKADLHKAEVDSLYTRYFPFRERYVSLYPVSSLGLSVHGGEKPEDASTAAQALHTERPPMWELIEKTSEKGIPALVEIRERKLAPNQKKPEQPSKDAAPAKTQPTKAKGSDKPESKSTQKGKGLAKQSKQRPTDSGDDSDGGFFE